MMSTEKLPNTLIIGAAKCGTTSLATALRSHPEVFMPTLKELSHFVEGGGQRVSEFSEYLKYFRSNRNAKIVGEASVAYIWCDSSARWIARDSVQESKSSLFFARRGTWHIRFGDI